MLKDKIIQYAPLVIITAALLVSVPRLAAVFSMIEPTFYGIPTAYVTGPAYGLATAGAALYTWHIYDERKGKKLAKYLIAGWVGLLVVMAIILTPGMLENLRQTELAGLLPFPLDLIWSALLAISAELAVALTALASALTKSTSRQADEDTRQLRADLKAARAELGEMHAELEQTRAELAQPRKLAAPEFADFARLCAEMDGQRADLTPSGANVALACAGYEPVSETRLRGWLKDA